MKYILTTLILLVSIFQITKAQLNFKIEELSLSNYDIELNDNIIDEDLESGPYVHFKCVIENNTEDTIILRPAKSTTCIIFWYQEKNYKVEVEPLPFIDSEKLKLSPKETIALAFGSNILLGTDIFNYGKGDYTKEMLIVLPTLKINYKDNNIKLQTDEIKSVVLK